MAASNNQTASSVQPLHVLIVGGGIGGLTAAIALRQQGHNVDIYEQSRFSQETGAAIHLAPNCNGVLRRLGLLVENLGGVKCRGLSAYTLKGKLVNEYDFGEITKGHPHPWHLMHRAHLHTALREMAVSENGNGQAVRMHLSSRVQSVDPDVASILFEDGTTVQGDLVIGADGLHSKTRKAIPGGDLPTFDSGESMFRFLLPTDKLAANPLTAPFVSRKEHMIIWAGRGTKLVAYPCVGGTIMNFGAIYSSSPESRKKQDGAGWQSLGSKSRMLEIFHDCSPGVRAIFEMAEEGELKVWNLMDMERMPSFVHNRLAVLGDSAHPFLPHQGQGGGQAIEDAISIATMLPLGTRVDEIPDRLRLYESCRYERAHKIQEATRETGRGGKSESFVEDLAYNINHDEYETSRKALEQYLASNKPSITDNEG